MSLFRSAFLWSAAALGFGAGAVFVPGQQAAAQVAASGISLPSGSANPRFALGFGLGWTNRADYGKGTFTRFAPEILAQTYTQRIDQNFYARPGLRLSYAWLQPEMPSAVRIEETDFAIAPEIGFLYDWYVVPALTFGAGANLRTLKIKTKSPVVEADAKLSRRETLYFGYVQAAVGLPLLKGFLVVEPYFRYNFYRRDSRIKYGYGVDTTFEIF